MSLARVLGSAAVSKGFDEEKDKAEVIDESIAEDTFLDFVYERLLKESAFSSDSVRVLHEIMQLNGYDTESLGIDVEIFETSKKSNVSELLANHMMMDKVVKIFATTKS